MIKSFPAEFIREKENVGIKNLKQTHFTVKNYPPPLF